MWESARVSCSIFSGRWIQTHPFQVSAQIKKNQFQTTPCQKTQKCSRSWEKNETLKWIVEHLATTDLEASPNMLISRAVLSNSFSGSRLLSSFQLAIGYSSSIVGNQSTILPQPLLEANQHQMTKRALNLLLRSQNQNTIHPGGIKVNDNLLFLVNFSQQKNPHSVNKGLSNPCFQISWKSHQPKKGRRH